METNKKDQDFPGYPHYPEKEDITRPENNNGKVLVTEAGNEADAGLDENEDIVTGTDADVTADDLKILEATDQNMNTPDDINLIYSGLDNTDADGDPLNEPGSFSDDYSGGGLDVPGSEDDDYNESIGEEDEENNYYSLGGDERENLEEDRGS